MSVPNPALPNQAAPVTLAQLCEALAFMTEQYDKIADTGSNVFVWLWESIQGDFNQDRSTGQIVFDAAISMIPGVDQVCDVRDIVANCKQINEDKSNAWAWVALGLTLIGLFPTLGSLVKGVLKIFFLFVRRSGGRAVATAVDEAMTWVITFLRKREVMKYWRGKRWDRVFHELAKAVKAVRAQVNIGSLLQAFDRGIALMNNLLGKVKHVPFVGTRAQQIIDEVVGIRRIANQHLGRALRPLQEVLDQVIRRLEVEDLVQRPRGILDTGNIHFTGGLPQTRALTLMRQADPPPSWLSRGARTKNLPLDPDRNSLREQVLGDAARGYPKLSDVEIASFTKGMRKDELVGPMRLYRIVSPSNMAASNDWMTEEVFQKIMNSPDPKAAWRKYLGVWPDWNANGQFVTYDVPKGHKLKVYRGPAAGQVREETLPDRHLEGGWEQIKFHGTTVFDADGKAVKDAAGNLVTKPDNAQFHTIDPATGAMSPSDITYGEWRNLPPAQQDEYRQLRTEINHPRMLGPFDTQWGYTDFDAQLHDVKLGLPALPGQVTNVKK